MKLTALVVEDDTTLQTVYRFILQRSGFDVHFAVDGAQAIRMLETLIPHLVFLDMLLPYVSGMDVLRFIRQSDCFESSRVVVTSSMEHLEREMQDEEFILKPIYAPVLTRIAQETRARFVGISS